MANDWNDSTTVQVKADRRQELEALRLQVIGERQEVIALRDLVDQVLEAGLASLSIAPASAFVDSQ